MIWFDCGIGFTPRTTDIWTHPMQTINIIQIKTNDSLSSPISPISCPRRAIRMSSYWFVFLGMLVSITIIVKTRTPIENYWAISQQVITITWHYKCCIADKSDNRSKRKSEILFEMVEHRYTDERDSPSKDNNNSLLECLVRAYQWHVYEQRWRMS